jgi:predicted Zn-dependent protease
MPDKAAGAEMFAQVVDAARAQGVEDVEAIIAAGAQALTRFANNAIHQNVSEDATHLSVRAVIGGRTARATTNRTDAEGIRAVVDQAIALTRLTEADPDLPPLAATAPYEPLARSFEATARATPGERAAAVAEAIAVVEDAGQTAAGIYSTGDSVFALFNSRGVEA